MAKLYIENKGNDKLAWSEDVTYKSKELYVDTKVRKTTMKKSKYPEDSLINNHSTVWGSWWSPILGWGY